MTRLWFTWAWTRLTRQHAIPWYDTKRAPQNAAMWENIAEAMDRQMERRAVFYQQCEKGGAHDWRPQPSSSWWQCEKCGSLYLSIGGREISAGGRR